MDAAKADAEQQSDATIVVCQQAMNRVDRSIEAFCVDQDEVGRAEWQDAVDACVARQEILWITERPHAACRSGDASLLKMVDDWEWSNDRRSLISACGVGNGGRGAEAFFNESSTPPYHCCCP